MCLALPEFPEPGAALLCHRTEPRQTSGMTALPTAGRAGRAAGIQEGLAGMQEGLQVGLAGMQAAAHKFLLILLAQFLSVSSTTELWAAQYQSQVWVGAGVQCSI